MYISSEVLLKHVIPNSTFSGNSSLPLLGGIASKAKAANARTIEATAKNL